MPTATIPTLALILHVENWENGLAAMTRQDNLNAKWELIEDIGFSLTSGIADKSWSGGNPIDSVPTKFVKLVNRFVHRQHVLLQLLYWEPRATDLLESNPALIWMLADVAGQGALPIIEAARLTVRKGREILTALGIAGGAAFVRTLAKVRFEQWNERGLRELYSLANRQEACSAIRMQVGFVAGELLGFVNRALSPFCAAFTSEFLQEAQTRARRESELQARASASMVADTVRLGRNLGAENIEERIYRLRSLAELNTFHDNLIERFNGLDRAGRQQAVQCAAIAAFTTRYGTNKFPEPPLEGTSDIVPIRTIEELMAEGCAMSHCVGTYGEEVMQGNKAIYRLLAPERATIELIRGFKRWELGQFKLRGNGEPSEETRAVVLN